MFIAVFVVLFPISMLEKKNLKKKKVPTVSLTVVQISLFQWQSLVDLPYAHFPRKGHRDLY